MKKIVTTLLLALMLVSCQGATGKVKPRGEKKDTLTIVTEKANAGDATAQNLLGEWCHAGKYVAKDDAAAHAWWVKSAKQDNPAALANLAESYQMGYGVARDSAVAIRLYKAALKKGSKTVIPQQEALAKKGSLVSARLLFDCYEQGVGVKRNLKKAETYQAMLAKAGDAGEQLALGLKCLNSNRNGEAAQWFKACMEQGNQVAAYYYGYLQFYGLGVAQNQAGGYKKMLDAAKSGVRAAWYEVGKALYYGQGVAQDYAMAYVYLARVAAQNKDAAWLLAMCELKNKQPDLYIATQWIAEGARKHEKDFNDLMADANYKYLQDYIMGLRKYFVDNDYAAALKLFRQVEKAGHAEGTTMQATCLANKNYDKRNPKKAVGLYRKAIAKGSHAAEYYLSSMCETGTGMKQADKAEALSLLKKAAEGDIAYAQDKLGDKYFSGDGVPQDFNEAARWYLNAESHNRLTISAARNLIACYEKSVSSLPDLKNAKQRIAKLKNTKENTTLIDMLKAIK